MLAQFGRLFKSHFQYIHSTLLNFCIVLFMSQKTLMMDVLNIAPLYTS